VEEALPQHAETLLLAARNGQRTVGEARRALSMRQQEFGEAAGSSHRTAVRWDAGKSIPADFHFVAMMRPLAAKVG